jgi:hypothetical protein
MVNIFVGLGICGLIAFAYFLGRYAGRVDGGGKWRG